jgi:hypothetical protein
MAGVFVVHHYHHHHDFSLQFSGWFAGLLGMVPAIKAPARGLGYGATVVGPAAAESTQRARWLPHGPSWRKRVSVGLR